MRKSDHIVALARLIRLKFFLTYHQYSWRRSRKNCNLDLYELANSPSKPVNRTTKRSLVVPIFNNSKGLSLVLGAIENNHPNQWSSIVLVNDASTDKKITTICNGFRHTHKNAICLENSENTGFGASVNRGIESCDGNIAIINTDIVLSPGGLPRLFDHLDNDTNMATITPMTNSGFLVAIPDQVVGVATPEIEDIEEVNVFLKGVALGHSVQIPSGVGFCMGISRIAFEEVGGFDTHRLGYGEDTAFCLSAVKLGWVNALAMDTFVGHYGGQSFGAKNRALIRSASFEIVSRFPNYTAQIESFLKQNPAKELMYCLAEKLRENKL